MHIEINEDVRPRGYLCTHLILILVDHREIEVAVAMADGDLDLHFLLVVCP